MSLRAKWTIALLLSGALPLVLLSWTTLRIQRRGLETSERQLEVAVIDHVAETVQVALGEAAEATHRVGLLLTEPKISDDDAKLELARDAMARSELLARVAIYSAEGKLIDAIDRKGEALDPPPPTIAGGEAANWSVGGPSGHDPLLLHRSAIVRDGAVRVRLLAEVRARELGQKLEGISRDRFEGRADGVLLVEDPPRVIAGGGDGPFAAGRSLAGADIFAVTTMPSDGFARPFAVATEFRAPSGEAMVGSVRSLPWLGAAIVVRRAEEAAYGELHASRRLLLYASAIFALLALVLGSWLAARTTSPVRRLVELTRAYARREFTRRSDVQTGDELEQLGGAMSEMADQLGASEIEIKRRAAVESDLSRYLPGEVARSIAEGRANLALGGERRAITVLFADVVSFTTFAEGAPPERVVAFLNELFTVLTEVVFRHGGTVDKFIGDCVMAVFGAPSSQEDHAARALAAAEDMHRFVEAQAPAWKATYGVDVRLGVGVNSGEALVGNLGSETRMEYTAIGDVVNVAARLEGLARPGQTLLTREVAARAGDGFSVASLGDHAIRGKAQAIEVLELR